MVGVEDTSLCTDRTLRVVFFWIMCYRVLLNTCQVCVERLSRGCRVAMAGLPQSIFANRMQRIIADEVDGKGLTLTTVSFPVQ